MILTHTFTIEPDYQRAHLIWYMHDEDTGIQSWLGHLHSITAEAEGDQKDCAIAFARTKFEAIYHHMIFEGLPLNQMRGQPFPIPWPLDSFDAIRLDISQVKIKSPVKITLTLDLEVFPITG